MLEFIENGEPLPLLIIDSVIYSNYRIIESFPLTNNHNQHISICDELGHEIFWIDDLSRFPEYQQKIIADILVKNRAYQEIKKIITIVEYKPHERWTIDIQTEVKNIYLETLGAVTHLHKGALLIQDKERKLYLIPDIQLLDAKSRQQIKHYQINI